MTNRIDCYVDRFEGDLAVLVAGNQEIIIPRSLLPAGAAQGDYFLITVTREHGKKEEISHEISDLQKRLKGENK